MSDAVRVGVVQMCSTPDIAHNVSEIRRSIARAAGDGATVVVFPENCTQLGPEAARLAHPLDLDGPEIAAVAEEARAQGCAVVLGSVAERGEDATRTFNTLVCLDASGRRVGSYRKIHLFDVAVSADATYRESATVAAGDPRAVVVELGGVRWGLSICYDVRFPELYRAHVAAGAEALLVPAAFTRPTGAAHWEVLLRARAIENLCWVVAPAQCGEHFTGRTTWGHSMVVSPWGEVVLDGGESSGVHVVTLDRALVAASRARIPSLSHRRL